LRTTRPTSPLKWEIRSPSSSGPKTIPSASPPSPLPAVCWAPLPAPRASTLACDYYLPLAMTVGHPIDQSRFFSTPVAAGNTSFPTYTITVNDTNPVWAYCRQTVSFFTAISWTSTYPCALYSQTPSSHCGAGMVFAANAVESSSKSFEAFTALAKQLNGTTASSNGTNTTTPNTASAAAGQSAVVLVAVALSVVALL
jgi:hypothetical protein